jgi:hypothetical protein
VAEALLAGAGHGRVAESAAARLWACAAGRDLREFAVCAGSVGLTMAEYFLRRGRTGLHQGVARDGRRFGWSARAGRPSDARSCRCECAS